MSIALMLKNRRWAQYSRRNWIQKNIMRMVRIIMMHLMSKHQPITFPKESNLKKEVQSLLNYKCSWIEIKLVRKKIRVIQMREYFLKARVMLNSTKLLSLIRAVFLAILWADPKQQYIISHHKTRVTQMTEYLIKPRAMLNLTKLLSFTRAVFLRIDREQHFIISHLVKVLRVHLQIKDNSLAAKVLLLFLWRIRSIFISLNSLMRE